MTTVTATTFAAFPEGKPCIIVMPTRGTGKFTAPTRFMGTRGSLTMDRSRARVYPTKEAAVPDGTRLWGRFAGGCPCLAEA